MTLLETLTKNNGKIDKINQKLDKLVSLFKMSKEDLANIFGNEGLIETRQIFESPNGTILLGIWRKGRTNWPLHCHRDSIEYLICLKGRFILTLDGVSRAMTKGDCASIAIGVKHSVLSLEDDSQMLGICIPPELAYVLQKE